ncbi:hypothetical protein ACFL10_00115 [Patescibacteria group bacterium]
MELSMFIAKLFGAVYIAMGLGILFNTNFYKKLFSEMMKDTVFAFTWGIFATIVGLLIIMNHNIWESSWVVIITLIGWIGFVKGALMLVFPKFINFFKPWFNNSGFLIVIGVGSVIFGGILSYFGWFL